MPVRRFARPRDLLMAAHYEDNVLMPAGGSAKQVCKRMASKLGGLRQGH
jgi:hypothetical protein